MFYTASRFRGVARSMSSTLHHSSVQAPPQTEVHVPNNHLCSLARTEHNLPFQFIALRDPKLPHRANGALVHVCGHRQQYVTHDACTSSTYLGQRPSAPHNAPPADASRGHWSRTLRCQRESLESVAMHGQMLPLQSPSSP